MRNFFEKLLKMKNTVVLGLLLCFCLALVVPLTAITVEASQRDIKFDDTDVWDDLSSSEGFNIINYPFDSTGLIKHPQIINVVEYCYSYKVNLQANFGLYLYFYNPQGLDIYTNSKLNKVELAVSYDNNGKPVDYEKFDLEFCSVSTEPDYYQLFYKYKVVDHVSKDGKKIVQRVNSNARRYDISSIELHTKGEPNASDYTIGGTYTFSGYCAGYGSDVNAQDTLTCDVTDLETLSLDVEHTYYRTKTSSLGAGYQNQLDTVYFTVPKQIFNDYGTLQRIKAEWWEYKTTDMHVTNHSSFYNRVLPFIGQAVTSYNSDIYYGYAPMAGASSTSIPAGDNAYNGFNCWGQIRDLGTPVTTLYSMFWTDKAISEYDPAGDIVTTGGVRSNKLYEYLMTYNKSFNKGTLPIKNNTISADLFSDDIDESRKIDNEQGKIQQGYSFYDFDASLDIMNWLSFADTNPSFWENASMYGFWSAIKNDYPVETGKTIAPIYTVKAADLQGSNAEIAERLLININEVDNLKERYEKSKETEELVLFRFATSNYYAKNSVIIDFDGLYCDYYNNNSYISRQSVFFDFDIIQLGFTRDGNYHVIPVVSDPVDIVNDITSPAIVPDGPDWLKWILIALAVIVILLLLTPFIPGLLGTIVKYAFKIAILPFKWLFLGIKKLIEKIRS